MADENENKVIEEVPVKEGDVKDGDAQEEGEFDVDTPVPLKYKWTWWYSSEKDIDAKAWTRQYRNVQTVGTIQEFWGVHNNIKGPGELPKSTDMAFFKEGIDTEWDSQENKKGGKWIIKFGPDAHKFDEIWIETIMGMISNEWEYSDQVCGVIISVRKKYGRMALWTKDAKDEEKCMRIGRHLKEALNWNKGLGYQTHVGVNKNGLKATDRYVL